MKGFRERLKVLWARATGVPLVDRLLRSYARADGLRFTRWAAAIALFGYLSIFPLVVLAFIALGFVLDNFPTVRTEVETYLQDSLPLLFDPQGNEAALNVREVARTTTTAGIVSVVALVLAGLGWADASIEGVRRMQGAMRRRTHVVLSKGQDLASLIAVGTLLLVGIVGAVLLQALGSNALKWIGLGGGSPWLVNVLAPIVSASLMWMTLVALYAGAWWSRPHRQWKVVAKGALGASLTLVLMMQLSFVIVGRTLSNPVYGTLAVAAALLLFLYFASAVVLYFASWIAVSEGAPPTQEEVAYASRSGSGDIMLPTASLND